MKTYTRSELEQLIKINRNQLIEEIIKQMEIWTSNSEDITLETHLRRYFKELEKKQ